MALTIYLRDERITVMVAAPGLEVIAKAMKKGRGVIPLMLITGKRAVVRADNIGLVREISDEEVAEHKERAALEQEAAKKQGRLVRVAPPPMTIPGGRGRN
jgi:hypothetical protein